MSKTSQNKRVRVETNSIIESERYKEPHRFPFSLFYDHRFALFAIFLSSILLYSNTIFNDYALDDQLAIYDNRYVTKGIEGFSDILTHDAFVGFFGERGSKLISGGRYRPISFLTFALEWELFGRNPMISHIVNIFIYSILCCSIYLFLFYLFKPSENISISVKWGIFITLPFVASILYTFHPIHTEVVANIKGRDELLSFLFGIWAFIYFFQYFRPHPRGYIILFSTFLLALLSKENAITFILIFPLIAYIQSIQLKDARFIKPYLTIILATIIFLLIRFKYTESSIDAYTEEILNNPFVNAVGGEKWATIIYSFFRYFCLLIFPHPLTHDYYFNQIPYRHFSDPIVILTIAALLGLLVYTWKAKKEILFGILFFIITFSIVSNIVFTVGIIMNERFVFVSSLGFCIILGYYIILLFSKLNKIYLTSFLSILLMLYSIKTFTRNFAWKDNLTLFGTDYQTSHNSAKVSTAFGGILMEQVTSAKPEDSITQERFTDSSIQVLEHSLAIYPTNSQALLLYGNAIYAKTKDKDAAIKIYKQAIRYRPNGYFDALYNIGILFYNANMFDSSLIYMEQALKANPEHRETRESLGKLYAKLGRTQDAIRLAGNNPSNLGELAMNAKDGGNYEEAIRLAEQALAANPNDSKANFVKGICYARFMNRIAEGIPFLEKAVSLEKTNSYWMEDLAVAYGMSGQIAKTIPLLEEVIRLRPNDPAGYRNIATSYANLGKADKAKQYMALFLQKSNASSIKK